MNVSDTIPVQRLDVKEVLVTSILLFSKTSVLMWRISFIVTKFQLKIRPRLSVLIILETITFQNIYFYDDQLCISVINWMSREINMWLMVEEASVYWPSECVGWNNWRSFIIQVKTIIINVTNLEIEFFFIVKLVFTPMIIFNQHVTVK